MDNSSSVEDMVMQTLHSSDLSAKQKAVLQASLTLFSDKGYDRTTTQEIAELAHVSQGTVYKRFATKHDILEALITPFIDEIIPRMAIEFTNTVHAQQLPDFNDYLSFVVRDRLELVVTNRELVRILLAGAFNNQSEAEALLARISESLRGVEKQFTAIFSRYQRNGQLVNWPVSQIIRYTAAAIISHALPVVLTADCRDPAEGARPSIDLDLSTRQIVAFLRHGLSPVSA